MKTIVYLNPDYQDAEIRYTHDVPLESAKATEVLEVSDLPKRISVKAFHPDDFMDSHTAVDLPRDAFVNLLRYLHANDRRIEAIMLVRSVTHWGLSDAKHFVESL